MVELDIQQFSEARTKVRAYFCYLFTKNLPNRLPGTTLDTLSGRLQKIKGDLQDCEGVYVLDERGVQVTPTYLPGKARKEEDIGSNRTSRAYYYRAMKEQRCTITDPYPSMITQELTVTASQPIFDEHGQIKFVACLDMPLNAVLRIGHPMAREAIFGKLFKYAYGAFVVALAMVALLLFSKGVQEFFAFGIDLHKIEVKGMFEATILLTLALAIFDLCKTLFEEEVLGRQKNDRHDDMHHTMVRFLGSIIIALSIEALMLVFKFAMTAPEMLINAIYILAGVGILLVGLAVYIKFSKTKIE